MAVTSEGRVIDGITCYSPELAEHYGNYPSEGFDVTVRIEERSFWCRSRNRLVSHLVKRFSPPARLVKFLEIGCGTGNVVGSLRGLPGVDLTGSEIYLGGLRHAKARVSGVTFIQVDATDMPFHEEFDLIGAFDVIEHIEDDRLVLNNVLRSLRAGGLFLLTVPQYRWLWSRLDELVHHQRRYTMREVSAKLGEAGFQVEFISSFVFVLFPLMLVARLRARSQDASPDTEAEFASEVLLPPVLNAIFDAVMLIDEWLIRMGVSLPFGGSVVAVARKPSVVTAVKA